MPIVDQEEGMGKRFKVKIKPKAIVKKAVKAQVKAVKKTVKTAAKAATSKVGKVALRSGAAYATGGASEAYLSQAKNLKNLASVAVSVVGKKGGGGSSETVTYDEVKTSQSVPAVMSQSQQSFADRAVESMPDALVEEVQEKDQAGNTVKVKKIKPVVKYGVMAGLLAVVGLIAVKKRR